MDLIDWLIVALVAGVIFWVCVSVLPHVACGFGSACPSCRRHGGRRY